MEYFIFDLYDTLIKSVADIERKETWLPVVSFFREHGLETDWQTLRRWYDEFWYAQLDELKKQKKFKCPEADVIKVFKKMASELGGEFSDETAEEAVLRTRRAAVVSSKPFDGTIQLLAALRAKGAKLYILTNAQSIVTRPEIEDLGLTNKFDGILISSDCGCKKPDPAFFQMLFDKYGIVKRKAIMIGDRQKSDIVGAKAAGIKSLLVKEGGAAAMASKILKLADEKK